MKLFMERGREGRYRIEFREILIFRRWIDEKLIKEIEKEWLD